ncbi:MAG TPA: methylthioribulose 1-phosphate dehydratase [Blastocatellia bacterium]|jgi:methylthioribulose-1-phosphate dehydratase|nr:methylthioribulose 1-phosphate dehydratase [Blastocatellia bacterium]
MVAEHSWSEPGEFSDLAMRLAAAGREFFRRGWVLGTSGNFSAVVSHEPLRLAITSSGVDKGALTAADVLLVDGDARVVQGLDRPSAETKLHIMVVRLRGAAAVLHTHSVWGTILSETYAAQSGLSIEGYEMLKGLEGVVTHEHSEWLPIIANCQDADALAQRVEDALTRHPNAHAFLIRRHGLYTWGQTIAEAQRHVEILEFLLEVVGRTNADSPGVRP